MFACPRLIILQSLNMNAAAFDVGVSEFVACMATIIGVTACGCFAHHVRIGVSQLQRRMDAMECVRMQHCREFQDKLLDMRAILDSNIAELRLDIANMQVQLNQRFHDYGNRHEPYDDGDLWDKVHDLELRLDTVEISDERWTLRFNELERGMFQATNLAQGCAASSDNPGPCTNTDDGQSIKARIDRIIHPNPWQEMCEAHDASHPELGCSPTAVWL